MGQTKSFPIPRNMPCSYMNHMWLEQVFHTFRQQHSRNMEFPPSITIVSCPRPVFSQEGYQWKGLKQLRSMRFCDSTPRQTKLRLHNRWSRTPKICHWPCNVKSTIRKAKPCKHNTKLGCIQNTGRYLQLHIFCTPQSLQIYTMLAGSCAKVVIVT